MIAKILQNRKSLFLTMSWSNVDTPYLIPTPFFKDINNKKDEFADRKNIFSLTAKQSRNQRFRPSL